MGAARDRPQFDNKPPLRLTPDFSSKLSPEVFFTRHQRFEIRVFPLLIELPKAIKPHLPVILLASRSHQVVFTYDEVTRPQCNYRLLVGFPGKSLGPTTGGFACNCPVPEVWTTWALHYITMNIILHYIVCII